eukprot:2366303-Pleurochrysis_carterae.AAC.1
MCTERGAIVSWARVMQVSEQVEPLAHLCRERAWLRAWLISVPAAWRKSACPLTARAGISNSEITGNERGYLACAWTPKDAYSEGI